MPLQTFILGELLCTWKMSKKEVTVACFHPKAYIFGIELYPYRWELTIIKEMKDHVAAQLQGPVLCILELAAPSMELDAYCGLGTPFFLRKENKGVSLNLDMVQLIHNFKSSFVIVSCIYILGTMATYTRLIQDVNQKTKERVSETSGIILYVASQ